jgi:hypothetical protein
MAFFIWRGYSLAGWLPRFWTQSGVFACWNGAIVSWHFGEAAVPELVGGGGWGPYPVFAFYLGIYLTTEEKSRKNLSQVSRKVPSWSVLGAIWCRFGHRFTGGLDWSAELSRFSMRVSPRGSTLGQGKYLPSCRTKGFPTPANLEP